MNPSTATNHNNHQESGRRLATSNANQVQKDDGVSSTETCVNFNNYYKFNYSTSEKSPLKYDDIRSDSINILKAGFALFFTFFIL